MRELVASVRRDAVEDALDLLLPLFPDGVHVLDDAQGATGDGPVELRALVPHDLPPVAGLEDIAQVTLEEVPDDWRERRRCRFRPRVYGDRLVVRPDWAEPVPEPLLEVVVEEGAAAFGTGEHPTTRACLEMLCQLSPERSLSDLGCGSGLLAIAASRLGWPDVVAVDTDARAVAAARANAARNDVPLRVARTDLLRDPPPPADVALANVPAVVHAVLATRLTSRTVVATGIERGESAAVVDGYAAAGYDAAAVEDVLGWTLFVGMRTR